MQAVSVSRPWRNPAQALRQVSGGRAALATGLFRDGEVPLARAAHVAEMDVAGFFNPIGRVGIPAIRNTAADNHADLDTLEQWLQSSSPTPPRLTALAASKA